MGARAGGFDTAKIMGGLYGDGIIALEQGFARAFIERLGEDLAVQFDEARARADGALPRGPNRFYVEIHPERLRGFVELVTHPWIVAVCEAVLGPEFKLVEVGIDVPGPGALLQPWHRDFPAPDATRLGRRLDSLAFNITTVDVDETMGPFEVAHGTQWDDDRNFSGGMFPPRSLYGRYESRVRRKLPRVGDVSARSALTIHRGTANHSSRARPVLVLGVDAPGARNAERHDLQFSRAYVTKLRPEVVRHTTHRVVDELEPIVQAHTIDGLLQADTRGGETDPSGY